MGAPIDARLNAISLSLWICSHIPPVKAALDGAISEDCSSGLVRDYVDDLREVNAASLVGFMPLHNRMERKPTSRYSNIKGTRRANIRSRLSSYQWMAARPDINVPMASKMAACNFSAITRLDQNWAAYQVAKAKNIKNAKLIKNFVIWGNHLIELVLKRDAAVIQARKLSCAMSATKAAADDMHDWFKGTWDAFLMAVLSEGRYVAPKDVFFSFPVKICPHNRQWKVEESL